ncbi:uncharacterized protein A4U43_C08F27170 [Asparagus officinalis]|nr:uncharacterized protein A4U43_C08F27170 [Asparagus officinalis]
MIQRDNRRPLHPCRSRGLGASPASFTPVTFSSSIRSQRESTARVVDELVRSIPGIEFKRRFNVRLWKVFTDCFNCLPVAAVIDDKIVCMHGGLSPNLSNLDQIKSLPRPTDVPDTGLLCDLLWPDPGREIQGWGMNDRGVSYTFGADKVAEFLTKHDLDLVCRAHQVVEDGYEFFADRQLVTVFSAPNYYGEFDNAVAMMSVDETLMCSFQILKPAEKKPKFMMSMKI